MEGLPLLSGLIFLPLVGAALACFIPRRSEGALRALALLVSLVVFLVSVPLWFWFDSTEADFQFVEQASWIPSLGIGYHVGVDGISLLLVLLTTFLMPLTFLSTTTSITTRVKEFVILMLVLETAMLGTFLALDLFLFYVFWELMLVPMYFLVGVWGGPRRIYAAVKFFLYTMAGSVLMLLAIVTLYFLSGSSATDRTFDFVEILDSPAPRELQPWLFTAFALAFAIKVPMFPFHTWLPDAHVEAPTAGSVILAAVLLKMGTYGFLRFCLPLFPETVAQSVPLFALLSVIGIIYGALVATMQRDMKKLVAYSSVSHLGFVMLGLFAFTSESMQGSLLQMVNHGISTGALFLLVGMLYERAHTRFITDFGGVARLMPVFAAFFLIVMFSSAGLPGTNGFVGEFLILVGTFKAEALGLQAYAIIGASGVILGAIYLLWMYQRVMQGPVKEPVVDGHAVHLTDIKAREIAVLVPFVILILWIGIYPKPFLDRTAASLAQVSERVAAADTRLVASGVAEMVFELPQIDWWAIAPVLAITLTGCVVMLADLFTPGSRRKGHLAVLSLLGLAVTAAFALLSWDYNQTGALAGMVAADNFSQFFTLLFVVITAVTILLSYDHLTRENFYTGEYYTLLLFSAAGMMLMASAGDLVMVFLGLELLSICLYILAGFSRQSLASEEASIKYLLLGSFATGFLLYGIALVYGTTGSTNLGCVAQALGQSSEFATDACNAVEIAGDTIPVMLLVGMGLLIVGLGFKAAVAPFHMWTPDVYEGAPTAITAYMSVAAKAAAFAAFLRVFLIAFPSLVTDWSGMIGVIAAITMIVGNTVAIAQQNVKRMLAYSSIAHAGYILVAIVAASSIGAQSVLFYTVAYTLMNLGAFAVVILLGRRGEENVMLADYAGLGYRQPLLAALMVLFMLSLAGIPPTAGFIGKFFIFRAALDAGQTWLAVVGVLASVISVYFYIRVIYLMYMVEPRRELGPPARLPWVSLTAGLAALGVIVLGLFPDLVLSVAGASVGFVS